MDSLLDLHDDVLYLLGQRVEHLDDRRQTLFDAGSTCRKLREHFAPFMYRRITQEDTVDDAMDHSDALKHERQHETTACSKKVQSLMRVLQTSTMIADHTQEVNIMKLGISLGDVKQIAAALTRLRKLRKLRFTLPMAPGKDVSGILHCFRFTTVTTLCICPDLDDLSGTFPNVETLNFDCGRQTTEFSTWSHSLGYQHVRHLEIGGPTAGVRFTFNWQPETLVRLAKNLPGLEYFGTRSPKTAYFEVVVAALGHFQYLRGLTMWSKDSFQFDVMQACQSQH